MGLYGKKTEFDLLQSPPTMKYLTCYCINNNNTIYENVTVVHPVLAIYNFKYIFFSNTFT